MTNKCPTCDKSFKSKQNLETHIATAKYCLKLRGENASIEFSCDYCDDKFSRKAKLNKHHEICVDYIKHMHLEELKSLKSSYVNKIETIEADYLDQQESDELIHKDQIKKIKTSYESKIQSIVEKSKTSEDSYKKELNQLQLQINFQEEKINDQYDIIEDLKFKLADANGYTRGIKESKPSQSFNSISKNVTKTINNNPRLKNVITTTISPLNQSLIEQHIPNFKLEGGVSGMIEFISNIVIVQSKYGKEQNYVSTDRARLTCYILKEKDPDIMWESDVGAEYIHRILDFLKPEAKSQYSQIEEDLLYEYGDDKGNQTCEYIKAIEKYDELYEGIINKNNQREKLFSNLINNIKMKIHVSPSYAQPLLLPPSEPLFIGSSLPKRKKCEYLPKLEFKPDEKDHIDSNEISNSNGSGLHSLNEGLIPCGSDLPSEREGLNSFSLEKGSDLSPRVKDVNSLEFGLENEFSNSILNKGVDLSITEKSTKKYKSKAMELADKKILELIDFKLNNVFVDSSVILTQEIINDRVKNYYNCKVLLEGSIEIADFIYNNIFMEDSNVRNNYADCNYFIFDIDPCEDVSDRDDREQNINTPYFSRLKYYRLEGKEPREKINYLKGVWIEDPSGSIINMILDSMQMQTKIYYEHILKKYSKSFSLEKVEKAYLGIMNTDDKSREQLFLKIVKRLEQKFK